MGNQNDRFVKCLDENCGNVMPEKEFDEYPQCPMCYGASVEVIKIDGVVFTPELDGR